MKKPISIITNNMGHLITIRSPFSRKWLFNLSISKDLSVKPIAIPALVLASLIFVGCNPTSTEETYAQSATYTVSDLQGDGKTHMNGADTLVYVTDPKITYYSAEPIQSAKVIVTGPNGTAPVPCYYIRGGNKVWIYNDEMYGAIENGQTVKFEAITNRNNSSR